MLSQIQQLIISIQQDNNEYTEFPITFRKIRLTPIGTEYNACTVHIEAPMKAMFICYTENARLIFPGNGSIYSL